MTCLPLPPRIRTSFLDSLTGVWEQFLLEILICEQITYMLLIPMTQGKQAILTLCPETFSRNLYKLRSSGLKLQATCLVKVPRAIHRWRKFDALLCHRNGGIICRWVFLLLFLGMVCLMSWSLWVGFILSQTNLMSCEPLVTHANIVHNNQQWDAERCVILTCSFQFE